MHASKEFCLYSMSANGMLDLEQNASKDDTSIHSYSSSIKAASVKHASPLEVNESLNADIAYDIPFLLLADNSETTHDQSLKETSSNLHEFQDMASEGKESDGTSDRESDTSIGSRSLVAMKDSVLIDDPEKEKSTANNKDDAEFQGNEMQNCNSDAQQNDVEKKESKTSHRNNQHSESSHSCSTKHTSNAVIAGVPVYKCANRASSPESTYLIRETVKSQSMEQELEMMDIEDEAKNSLGELHLYIPPISRGRSNANRFSILSMASSIAAIAPYISSHSNDNTEEEPINVFGEAEEEWRKYSYLDDVDMENQALKNNDSVNSPCESLDEKNLGRLSRMMQSAVLNAKKKKNPEVTQRAMEEWSSSLENCFSSIKEDSISFNIPETTTSTSPVEERTFSSTNTSVWGSNIPSKKKNKNNPFSRISRMWLRSSTNDREYKTTKMSRTTSTTPELAQPNPETHGSTNTNQLWRAKFEKDLQISLIGAKFDDSCSFVTAPDSDSERDHHLSCHSTPPSLSVTRAETSLDTDFTCHTIDENSMSCSKSDLSRKQKRKRNKVASIFRYLLGSSLPN